VITMKLAALALIVAGAAATAPPRLSLNLGSVVTTDLSLSGIGTEFVSSGTHNDFTADTPASYLANQKGVMFKHKRFTSLTEEDHTGRQVTAHRDLTLRCPAGRNMDASKCQLPTPEVHDHHQVSGIAIYTRVYHIRDSYGQPVDHSTPIATCVDDNKCVEDAIAFTARGNYLMRYDASDAAGNQADQLVFMLTLDDEEKPTFTYSCSDQIIEAAPYQHPVCTMDTADDNVDGDVTSRILYYARYECDRTASGDLCDGANYATIANVCADLTRGRCTKAQLAARITGFKVGLFYITGEVTDKAGSYGAGGKNNLQKYDRLVTVRDQKRPVISLRVTHAKCDGAVKDSALPDATTQFRCCVDDACATMKQQCGYQYNEPKATAIDALDSRCSKSVIQEGDQFTKCNAQASNWQASPWVDGTYPANLADNTLASVVSQANNPYEVHFNVDDNNGNSAAQVTRFVEVVDTESPAVELYGNNPIIHRATADNQPDFRTQDYQNDAGHPKPSFGTDPGINCQDACDPANKLTVTTAWIKFEGNHVTKSGSACDNNACEFDNQVIGTYTREYTCTDSSGNSRSIERQFINEDKNIPVITPSDPDNALCSKVGGEQLNIVCSANLNGQYSEPAFTCTDYHNNYQDKNGNDGVQDISSSIIPRNRADSCSNLDSTKAPALDSPGTYYITYDCKDEANNDAVQLVRTITIKDDVRPVLAVNGCSEDDKLVGCENDHEAGFAYTDAGVTVTDNMMASVSPDYPTQAVKRTSSFIECTSCQDNHGTRKNSDHVGIASLDAGNQLVVPHVGNYVIKYDVKDFKQTCVGGQGDNSAEPVKRTLRVRDTLVPVITLKNGNTVLHKGSVGGNGINGVANPVLMAEHTQGVNGWLIAAAASAVTGLALLAMSKKPTTSVPV